MRVLVTGGGKGIGRGIVERFAADGASVAFCGRSQEPLDRLSERLAAQGITHLARSVDVSDEAAVIAFVAEVAEAFGGIDVLVNNAALTYASGIDSTRITEMTGDAWRNTLAVNLDGAFYASREVAKVMRAAGNGGSIINISSVHAHTPSPVTPAYDAAKGAIESLTRNMALALGADGIRVNGVAPGPIASGDNPVVDASLEAESPFAQYTILRRFGRNEEIASVVAFLAS
ncbi:MAG: SDR family oxidoreductase, partial [Thermomicrobiales bacterium]|nr:SDR family oxidoreductase [Thermomicrobiales bacterium]